MDFVVKAWISGIFPRPIHWYSLNMGIGETNLIETAQRPRRSCTLCIRDIFLSFPEINGLIPTTCTTKLPQFLKRFAFCKQSVWKCCLPLQRIPVVKDTHLHECMVYKNALAKCDSLFHHYLALEHKSLGSLQRGRRHLVTLNVPPIWDLTFQYLSDLSQPFTSFSLLMQAGGMKAAPDIISFLQRKKETPAEIKKLSLESTIEILIHAPFSEGCICFSDFNVCGATVDWSAADCLAKQYWERSCLTWLKIARKRWWGLSASNNAAGHVVWIVVECDHIEASKLDFMVETPASMSPMFCAAWSWSLET